MPRSHWSKITAVVALLASVQLLSAQEQGLPDSLYYIGVGIDQNLDKARSSALNILTQEIQVLISSSFENRTTEVNTRVDQHTVSWVVTHSILDLKDVKERIAKTQDESYRVTKYIPKSTVRHMFELRRNRILELIQIGERELQGGSVHLGSALKNFYWALLLGKLYPDTLSFSVRLDSATLLNFGNVPMGISNIFDRLFRELSFKPDRMIDDESIVWNFKVEVNKKPVASLHFDYFDGMGQTEADVKNGGTRLTFFFAKKELREREITLGIEYRYADEMDELTRVVDSLMSVAALPNRISTVLPAGSSPMTIAVDTSKPAAGEVPKETKPPETKPLKPQSTLPTVLQEILAVGNNFNAVRIKLDSLARRNEIILGSATDFESLRGLYGLVLGPEGVLALLSFKDKKYFDALTGKEANLAKYGGKRITWIEVLK